jgi:hypothetical protein
MVQPLLAPTTAQPATRLRVVSAPDAGTPSGLPEEWQAVVAVEVAGFTIDQVVVGPNGVFTIAIDPAEQPAVLEDDGLYRESRRITTPVKSALAAAFALRSAFRDLGAKEFPYPLLVSPTDREGHLGRLRIVPPHRFAEAIWSHPGRPLRRSQRCSLVAELTAMSLH